MDTAQEFAANVRTIVTCVTFRLYGSRSQQFGQKVRAMTRDVEENVGYASPPSRVSIKLVAPHATAAEPDRAVAFDTARGGPALHGPSASQPIQLPGDPTPSSPGGPKPSATQVLRGKLSTPAPRYL